MKCETETLREIWNDQDKSCIEVGPDRDGMGLVELRYRDEDGKVKERMSFPSEMARHVAAAIKLCAAETEATGGLASSQVGTRWSALCDCGCGRTVKECEEKRGKP